MIFKNKKLFKVFGGRNTFGYIKVTFDILKLTDEEIIVKVHNKYGKIEKVRLD